MENSKQRTESLIDAYLSGEATAEQRNQLERLYASVVLDAEIVDDLKTDQILQLKEESLMKLIDEIHQRKRRDFIMVRRLLSVAAAVTLIVLGVYFLSYRNARTTKQDGYNLANNDITPGKNTAILTLLDGTTVSLSDQQSGIVIEDDHIVYNNGAKINGTALTKAISSRGNAVNHEMLTASTPRGGTYQVFLPDGTRVWLNADSKISFPVQFSGEIRKILLTGEAYFEVAKNKSCPFVVESLGQTVTVLGTHFNVNAYTDEADIKTTLLEGSVRVQSSSPGRSGGDTGTGVILRSNQQAAVGHNSQITVKEVTANEVLDWKNGDFIFKEEPIETIMRKVSRWYNIEVVYDGDIKERFTGTVSRNKNLSQVLYMLEKAKGVHFKIDGKKLIVSK